MSWGVGGAGEGSHGFRTGGPDGEEVEGHTRKLVLTPEDSGELSSAGIEQTASAASLENLSVCPVVRTPHCPSVSPAAVVAVSLQEVGVLSLSFHLRPVGRIPPPRILERIENDEARRMPGT